jgi:NAD(P)-dependent dehydrogenase (short-subunit alcohol dehydrogenase family)
MSSQAQTWVVTGAASGIGRAVARAAHANGANVVAVDLDGDGLAALAGELDGLVTVTANVSLPDDADRIVSAAADGVHVLVNNAAIMDGMMLVDETPDDYWQRVLAVNLTGPFLLSKRVLPGMIERGAGVIVNVSSIAGLRGAFAGAAYTSSKHGVVGLTRSIAYTYKEDGIRSVCVCPGATAHGSKGAMEEGAGFSERGFMRVTGGQLPTVIGHPEDVASVIMFAASDAGVRLNGAVLTADDGLVL